MVKRLNHRHNHHKIYCTSGSYVYITDIMELQEVHVMAGLTIKDPQPELFLRIKKQVPLNRPGD